MPSWFVHVEKIKEDLLAANAQTYWVPSFVKEKRFHNWLRDARDWAISRSRYWGTPLPLWVSDDGEEIVCITSVAELEKRSGVTGITDLHKDKIDHITIPSEKGKGQLKRIEEVCVHSLPRGSVCLFPFGLCTHPSACLACSSHHLLGVRLLV